MRFMDDKPNSHRSRQRVLARSLAQEKSCGKLRLPSAYPQVGKVSYLSPESPEETKHEP